MPADCKSAGTERVDCRNVNVAKDLPERMRNLPERNGKLRNIVLDGAGRIISRKLLVTGKIYIFA